MYLHPGIEASIKISEKEADILASKGFMAAGRKSRGREGSATGQNRLQDFKS